MATIQGILNPHALAGRALAAAPVLLCVAGSPAGSQTVDSDYPRAWGGNPDLNGIWQAVGTAHRDLQDHSASAGPAELGAIGAVPPGQGVVVDNEIPYQPEALE